MEDELDVLLSQFNESQFASLLFNEAAAMGPGDNIPCLLNLTGDTTHASFGLIQPRPSFTEDPSTSAAATSLRFSLSTDSQVNAVKLGSVSKNTAKNTTPSVNIWKECLHVNFYKCLSWLWPQGQLRHLLRGVYLSWPEGQLRHLQVGIYTPKMEQFDWPEFTTMVQV